MTHFTLDANHDVLIPHDKIELNGILHVPSHARGIVLFVHGSGSGRLSPRNQHVANILNQVKLATLLFDLLTPEEEIIDEETKKIRFNIDLLASRLLSATDWCANNNITNKLPIGYFGASTGGGAALMAAAHKPGIKAIVSRGGRPDLAGKALSHVKAPTLLIVGGNDKHVIEMNRTAMLQMNCIKKLEIVSGATHLFEEPGALDEVANLAKAWFIQHLN